MAVTKLRTNRTPIISMEQQTTVFASSATLSGAGFTVPGGAHEVHLYPSVAGYLNNKGTATASNGSHRFIANQMITISHAVQASAEIITDSAATVTAAYMK